MPPWLGLLLVLALMAPRYGQIFRDFGASPSRFVQGIVAAGHVVAAYWFVLFPGWVAVTVGVVLLGARRWVNSAWVAVGAVTAGRLGLVATILVVVSLHAALASLLHAPLTG